MGSLHSAATNEFIPPTTHSSLIVRSMHTAHTPPHTHGVHEHTDTPFIYFCAMLQPESG